MRFVTPVLLIIFIGVLVWQSLDIKSYRDWHTIEQEYPVKDEEVFFQDVEVIQSPQDEKWLLKLID